jgi:hypothetical protein
MFFAGGENGLRAFSKDGVLWTNQTLGKDGENVVRCTFSSGRCVVASNYGGDRLCHTSNDGVQWQDGKLPGRPYGSQPELLYSESGKYYLVMRSDGDSPELHTSRDGLSWSQGTKLMKDFSALRHDAHFRGLASDGKGTQVVIGDYGARVYREAGTSVWIAIKGVEARDTLVDVAYGNGLFVGSGMHGLRMSSKDGKAWSERQLGEEGEHINTMLWDGKRFVGVGQGATYFSPDGEQWERVPNHDAPTYAAFGNGTFIGVLWPGRMLHSKDAIHWEETHKFPSHVLALGWGRLG